MNVLNWIAQISQSTVPGKIFDARWIYVVCSVFVPAAIGASVTFIIMALEKIFRVHGGGGH